MTPPITPFTIPYSAYAGSQVGADELSLGSLPAEFAATPAAETPAMDLEEEETEHRKRKRAQAEEEDSAGGGAPSLHTSPNASQAERRRRADEEAMTFALVLAHQQEDSPLLALSTPLLVFLLSHYLDHPLGYLDLLALSRSCKQLHHLLLASPAAPLVWSAVHSYDFSPVGKHATKDRIAEVLFRCRGMRRTITLCAVLASLTRRRAN
jgi:hypothetical protein